MEVLSADGFVIDHEELAEKFTTVSNFSKREAEVFVLRNIAELSVEETAKKMDVSTGSVSEYSTRYREKFSEAESLLELRERYS